jgi:beta-mannosidase
VHGPWEHQGLEAQHTLWNASTSLFNGEFGCEGMPHLATIRRYVYEDLWPATRDNPAWAHRGDWWINEPAVQAAFGGIADLETLTRASQLLQAHGLRVAIESTRRRRPRNSGAVVWHLHEPFPAGYATSLIDYDGHPKPAYAAVARAYAPVLVAATLERTAWTSGPFRAEPWVSSFVGAGSGELCARLLTAAGEELASWRQAIAWPASGTGFGDRIDYPLEAIPAGAFFLDLWVDGVAAARYALVRGPDLGALLRLPPEVLETSPQKTPR